MRVLIDGVPQRQEEAAISVFDWGVVRGFGCFEVIRSYGGRPFRVSAHLDRMETSASALGLDMPVRADLEAWIDGQAAEGGDCLVRCYLTAGSRDTLFTSPARTVVFWEEPPQLPDVLSLLPLAAPWHAAGAFSELTRAKTLSYAPNMAATIAAQEAGFDDALLLARDETVLEGPTFSICWFRGGVLETPTLELGVLPSITRAVVLEAAGRLGIGVREGTYHLAHLLSSDEVAAMSTVKEFAPVGRLGTAEFVPGPMTKKLGGTVQQIISEELGT